MLRQPRGRVTSPAPAPSRAFENENARSPKRLVAAIFSSRQPMKYDRNSPSMVSKLIVLSSGCRSSEIEARPVAGPAEHGVGQFHVAQACTVLHAGAGLKYLADLFARALRAEELGAGPSLGSYRRPGRSGRERQARLPKELRLSRADWRLRRSVLTRRSVAASPGEATRTPALSPPGALRYRSWRRTSRPRRRAASSGTCCT